MSAKLFRKRLILTLVIAATFYWIAISFMSRRRIATGSLPAAEPMDPNVISLSSDAQRAYGRQKAYERYEVQLRSYPKQRAPRRDGFELPFLKEIKIPSKLEDVFVKMPNGTGRKYSMLVFRDEKEVWVRAEYWQSGAEVIRTPITILEEEYVGYGEKITALGGGRDWSIAEIIEKCREAMNIENAYHFAITRVQMAKLSDPEVYGPPKPYVIVEMFGVEPTSEYIPDREPFLRARVILDEMGGIGINDVL
jgi:hypothetical protein